MSQSRRKSQTRSILALSASLRSFPQVSFSCDASEVRIRFFVFLCSLHPHIPFGFLSVSTLLLSLQLTTMGILDSVQSFHVFQSVSSFFDALDLRFGARQKLIETMLIQQEQACAGSMISVHPLCKKHLLSK